ncbi:glycoside hydrolase family 15 protein [Alicyclobacillus acidoterrestris]|uniref:Glycoside hydrolase family 15 protein n=1 Tax=Alicyclobacillus acidoterrestris (strain ATCC 49025 / DSM 3922 / CIP 106132 / NCIMB 13137 / GD3B) TaxID=1356854 RepID=T0BUU7_ALIAG|nr:glycoside hydrolase family 15 protein [Alicyclobacillus acidoterrestris]EPZ44205.1 hypothetical protein N007_11825 [Alicyclobacillus acidoterrestris ATCC 49025]UNO49717.1 glycoside hydrolase family 15 protein [Alicyclobacillus acidoterrestris]
MRDQVQQVLDTLRLANGLYVASPSNTYHYVWIRDVCYMALSDIHRDNSRFEETYHCLFDIFRKYKWKLAYHATHKPHEAFEYIHPRYTADTLEEVHEPWGNAQNDAIGAFLFGVGEGLRQGRAMLRDDEDKSILTLLVSYLITLEYWHDADNGMWEENREIHASSIGACVAGLLAIRPFVDVPWEAIQQGLCALYRLLPYESVSKEVDMALLSLVYPYRLLPAWMSEMIVERVEGTLLRRHGVIRYVDDKYYAQQGQEAEWCMGLPWLGICHALLGHREEAFAYLARSQEQMTADFELPELYQPVTETPNENTPLGWSQSMWLILYDMLYDS